MIKIFSTDKVRELDKYTIQNEPISSIDLVERAATVFTSEFCRRYSKQTRIIVFAGQGNNGADALAIARMLTDAGYRVETYLFNPTMRLSDDCELNKQRLLHMEKIEFTEVVDDFVPPELEERDVVIDGLFGSGLNRPLTGGFAAMVRYINQSDATVVAIEKEDFKTKLEQAYGSQWFKRGVPKAVYDKANQLASEKNYEITDVSEEYSPWDCLTLIDYRRIATYGSNWRDIFEKYYTKPGEEKGGNKEAKTEWMQKLERIRNNNFHTYSVKEEEFEFLSELHKWLIETSD